MNTNGVLATDISSYGQSNLFFESFFLEKDLFIEEFASKENVTLTDNPHSAGSLGLLNFGQLSRAHQRVPLENISRFFRPKNKTRVYIIHKI